eukprot:SAG31_NODE_9076_length_1339_cov_1.739516_2_plen_119_part_01
MKIVQVTDVHLRAAKTTVHWGYRSQGSLAAVLDAVASDDADTDLLIVTGDCVHAYPLEDEPWAHEGAEAYHLLRTMITARLPGTRIRAIPGNHDSRGHLTDVFPESAGSGGGTSELASP